jgi:hypothetical protein
MGTLYAIDGHADHTDGCRNNMFSSDRGATSFSLSNAGWQVSDGESKVLFHVDGGSTSYFSTIGCEGAGPSNDCGHTCAEEDDQFQFDCLS